MNVIEAFFLTLGLDASEYEKKQKEVMASLKKFSEASDKQTKLIAESGKKAAGAFSLLKIEVLGALAAFGMGAGFKDFIESNVTGNAALGRMSRNLKMSAGDLKAWGYAAQSVGGHASDATNALQTVAKGIAEAKLHGTSPLMKASYRYGVGITASDTPEQAMMKIQRAVYEKEQKHGPQQAMALASELTVTSYGMQQLMLMRTDKFKALLAHYRTKTGGIDTGDAMALQKTWTDIQADVGQLKNQVFAKMAPAMEVFAKKFETFLDKITPKLEALGERFANWLASLDWNKVIADIGHFIDKVQSAVKEMGGWKRVAEVLGGILALKILSPIIGLVFNLGKLGPLLTGAITGTTGLAAAFGSLGVALAACAGYWAGSEIWTHMLEGNKAGDYVGKVAAYGAAQFGDKDAQDAINRMNGKGPKHPSYYHPEKTTWYKAKESQAIRYFQSQGFTLNEAVGMAANIARESTFNPHALGDNGKAYGLGQWHPDRQANFAKVMGLPIQSSSYAQQLAFYAYEVKHNKRLMEVFSRKPNAGAAAGFVSLLDERPANKEGEAALRARMANNMVTAYIGARPTAKVAGAKSSTTTNDVRINSISIHTKADNAYDIFKDARQAVSKHPLIAASVTSLG